MLVLPVTNHYALLIKLAEKLGWDVVGDVERDRHLDAAPVDSLLASYYVLANSNSLLLKKPNVIQPVHGVHLILHPQDLASRR